jgi:osmotically-inducible protein OsmY
MKTITITSALALLGVTCALLVSSATARATDTDDRIESTITKSYVFKTYLKDDAIKAECKNGVVTLAGTVSEAFPSALAQDTVGDLPGVKIVYNKLTVKGEGPAVHSDTLIALRVKTALLFHSNVRATKTDVNVKDGVVILSGEASSLAQKELTTEYARDIENVKEVKNEMTIAKTPALPVETSGEKIDDASITAQVKAGLLTHRSTSVFKTKVTTTEGVVTITGIAQNAAAKSLVTKLITDINGVGRVINNMTTAVPVAAN